MLFHLFVILQLKYLLPDFLACSDKDDVPVIVFVSKMVPVEKKMLPVNKQRYSMIKIYS